MMQSRNSYIWSQFMGTPTAVETFDSFKVLCNLNYVHNMIQISMKEPNVNWKMIDIANEHCKEQDLDAPSLLEIGSCGLHVFHGAYETAQSVTSWKLNKFLKNCFSIFKNKSC